MIQEAVLRHAVAYYPFSLRTHGLRRGLEIFRRYAAETPRLGRE
jgi:hypothetical protein